MDADKLRELEALCADRSSRGATRLMVEARGTISELLAYVRELEAELAETERALATDWAAAIAALDAAKPPPPGDRG
jgi:hypothetical protein